MALNWIVASSLLGDSMHAESSNVNTYWWYWLEMAIIDVEHNILS